MSGTAGEFHDPLCSSLDTTWPRLIVVGIKLPIGSSNELERPLKATLHELTWFAAAQGESSAFFPWRPVPSRMLMFRRSFAKIRQTLSRLFYWRVWVLI